MSHLFLKPGAPGLVVRDPHTKRALPEVGGRVRDNTFWRRRLRSGDAVEAVEGGDKPTDTVSDLLDTFNGHTNATSLGPTAPRPKE
jgi:hypothetical protein